jgi:hypothetical protein
MKNQMNELPPVDQKYKNIVVGELVTLVDEVNDKNVNRVYEVLSTHGKQITVKVIAENPINDGKVSKQESLIGRVFTGSDSQYFQPYL